MIEIAGVALEAQSVAIVAGAALLGGFLRGFVGFGGALALVPALALALGPRTAVAIASIVGLPAVVQFLPEALRHADRARVGPLALAILAGAPLGSLILTSVSPRIMTGAIGALVTLLALATWMRPSRRIASRLWVNLLAGGFSGVLQGAAGVGGPPSVAILMAQGGDARALRANVLAATGSIAVAGALSHWWFGLFTQKAVTLGLMLLPLFVGASWAGSRFFATGGRRYFRVAAMAVLVVIGVLTFIAALRAPA